MQAGHHLDVYALDIISCQGNAIHNLCRMHNLTYQFQLHEYKARRGECNRDLSSKTLFALFEQGYFCKKCTNHEL